VALGRSRQSSRHRSSTMPVVGTVLRRTGDVNARKAQHAAREPARLPARDRGQSRQIRHFAVCRKCTSGAPVSALVGSSGRGWGSVGPTNDRQNGESPPPFTWSTDTTSDLETTCRTRCMQLFRPGLASALASQAKTRTGCEITSVFSPRRGRKFDLIVENNTA
jgi:hypothetical protein